MDGIPLPVGKRWHGFFLHRTEDPSKEVMLALLNKLEMKGYRCGYYEQDFTSGESFLNNLAESIEASILIIPWISLKFLESRYCMRDLDMATFAHHFSDKMISVLPVLYHVPFHQIPKIVRYESCFDVNEDDLSWINEFIQRFPRQITHTLHKVSGNQEDNLSILSKKFEKLDVKQKITFTLNHSAVFFDMPDTLNSLLDCDLRDIFKLCFTENKKCSHSFFGNVPPNVLERKCIKSFIFSFNSTLINSAIEMCGENFIKKLSRTCALTLMNRISNNLASSNVCACFEYILSNPIIFPNENKFKLCYERVLFVKDIASEPIQFVDLVVYNESQTQILRLHL